MLVDVLRLLEPCLANWSGLDSTYLNATVRAKKLSDSRLDSIYYKLLIVVRGFSIIVVSVSPLLKKAYQKITVIILMLFLTKVFVELFPNYSKIRNLFLLNFIDQQPQLSHARRYSKQYTDVHWVLSSFELCCLWILVFLNW